MAAVPYPDPDRPLDFDAIGAGRQSNPGDWPEPFAPRRRRGPAHAACVGEGHFVRALRAPAVAVPKTLAAAGGAQLARA